MTHSPTVGRKTLQRLRKLFKEPWDSHMVFDVHIVFNAFLTDKIVLVRNRVPLQELCDYSSIWKLL